MGSVEYYKIINALKRNLSRRAYGVKDGTCMAEEYLQFFNIAKARGVPISNKEAARILHRPEKTVRRLKNVENSGWKIYTFVLKDYCNFVSRATGLEVWNDNGFIRNLKTLEFYDVKKR